MKTVSREVGRCLTETKLKSFDDEVLKFAEFVNVSQFESQPKFLYETVQDTQQTPDLDIGYVLYGINGEDGSLTWLGQIIDSSD